MFLSFSPDRYAQTVGARHFHTSAKLNKGIEEMFFDLSKSKSYHMITLKIKCLPEPPVPHITSYKTAKNFDQLISGSDSCA